VAGGVTATYQAGSAYLAEGRRLADARLHGGGGGGAKTAHAPNGGGRAYPAAAAPAPPAVHAPAVRKRHE
jgi:hypothetical protein